MTHRKLIQQMRELGRRSAAKRAKENFDYSSLGKKAWEGKTKKEIEAHMKMMREAVKKWKLNHPYIKEWEKNYFKEYNTRPYVRKRRAARQNERYWANIEKSRAEQREYYHKNIEKMRAKNRKKYLKKKEKLSTGSPLAFGKPVR